VDDRDRDLSHNRVPFIWKDSNSLLRFDPTTTGCKPFRVEVGRFGRAWKNEVLPDHKAGKKQLVNKQELASDSLVVAQFTEPGSTACHQYRRVFVLLRSDVKVGSHIVSKNLKEVPREETTL
jgi:hypothetical protein